MDQNPPVLTRSNITCFSGSKTPCTCTPHPSKDSLIGAPSKTPCTNSAAPPCRKTTPNASTTPCPADARTTGATHRLPQCR